MGLLLYLLLFWGLMWVFNTYLAPRRHKLRLRLKAMRNHCREHYLWDRDRLTPEALQELQELQSEGADMAKRLEQPQVVEAWLNQAHKRLDKVLPARPGHQIRGILETLVVVFGVVMGFRAIALQPFKIPTGSMQPTLYGIHLVDREQPPDHNWIVNIFNFMTFGREPVAVIAPGHGPVVEHGVGSRFRFGALRLWPYLEVQQGDRILHLPGDANTINKYLRQNYYEQHGVYLAQMPLVDNPRAIWDEGDVLARGYLVAGDHLFVDRVWYNFFEPRRGDIVVFNTRGIRYAEEPLNGFFYIKRLVGLPGDTLTIRDRKLYVKRPGDADFQIVDGEFDEGFERMYSMQGGYRGYYLPPGPQSIPNLPRERWPGAHYLNRENPEITLGEDEYFMMGDNSENSLDSRYWGPVPRQNIIGLARIVWWPLSRRFGFVDQVKPEDYPSPPMLSDEAGLTIELE